MVYKSAGDRKDIYRVVLKKAIQDNIESLDLIEKGQLVSGREPITEHIVTDPLDQDIPSTNPIIA